MNIEKNLTDKALFTLKDAEGGKDNIKSRLDLQEMGTRSSLHLREVQGSYHVIMWLVTLCFPKKV